MSLARSEQQVLAEIESRLRRSDPALAARLALFRRHAGRGRGPAWELLSPWRACRPPVSKGIAVLIAVIVVTALTIGLAEACGQPDRAAAAMRALQAASHQAQLICCPAGSSAFSAAPACASRPARPPSTP